MGGVALRVPYLRQAPSGFYWEPSRKIRALGFRPEALGKEPATAIARAKALNQQVAAQIRAQEKSLHEPPRVIEGTIAWAVAEYQKSENWKVLAEKTRVGYRQALKRIEDWSADKAVSGISRRAVKIWYREMAKKTPAYAAATVRVLRVVLHFAKDEGWPVADLSNMRLHVAGGDAEPWEDFEISAYLDEARRQGRQSMALALMLGVCLGQRQGDVLRLPRSSYDVAAGTIMLRQHKTARALALPVLPELAREIALTPTKGTIFVVSEKSGKPYKGRYFARIHREICKAAGISDRRWFMHLRHTAATRLGEAGCADDLIRAITGHQSRSVVARYVRPSDTMAKAAITKLQEHRGKSKT